MEIDLLGWHNPRLWERMQFVVVSRQNASPTVIPTEYSLCSITFVETPVDGFSALQGMKSTDTLLNLAVLSLSLFLSHSVQFTEGLRGG